MPRPDKLTLEELTVRYHKRWQLAREGRIEKCLADILGHAREHEAFAGIDRGVHPVSLQHLEPQPFSLATLREAMIRSLAYTPPPPLKPWISSRRAAELEASGVRRQLIELVFAIG